jgi:ComF family protein
MPHAAAPVVDRAARLGRAFVDLLLPRQCLGCRAIIDTAAALCSPCWSRLRFIDEPSCARCGTPMPAAIGEGAVCGACAAAPPPFARARSALIYDDESRGLVLMFKNGDRTDAAPALAAWMARAGGPLVAEADLIVPVPLHWTRLFRRRYNQAALLGHALARRAGVACVPDLLVRRRRTAKLGHLGRDARARAVGGAIEPHRRRGELARNRRILLVDDVLTTGATVAACVRALERAGAEAVDVLTLARVVRPAR